MASFIRLDLFPATVTVNGTTSYSPSRAVVTDDAVHVYMDSDSGPAEVYSTRLDDFEGRATIGYTATGADEDVVSISRARGCGCGSRLRGFMPFMGVPHIYTQ